MCVFVVSVWACVHVRVSLCFEYITCTCMCICLCLCVVWMCHVSVSVVVNCHTSNSPSSLPPPGSHRSTSEAEDFHCGSAQPWDPHRSVSHVLVNLNSLLSHPSSVLLFVPPSFSTESTHTLMSSLSDLFGSPLTHSFPPSFHHCSYHSSFAKRL